MADASAASAASVASRLLDFYREPVVHRPRYLAGLEPLPEGHVVLRLALGRLPQGWLRDLPAGEQAQVREAARAFVRQVCLRERATHYQVLCLESTAPREAVRENYHLLMALIHPDRQESAAEPWPTGCAQHVNQAYEALSNPESRAEYDAGLARASEGAALDAWTRTHAEGPRRHRGRSVRLRPAMADVGRRVAVVAGVLFALFAIQAWWVGGAAPEYSLLERSFPSSARWVRDVLPDTPRFLGGPAPFDFTTLTPLAEPRRLAALGSWVPVADPRREATPEPASAPAAEPAPVATREAAPAPPPAQAAAPQRVLATAPSIPADGGATPPIRLAQAAPRAPASNAPTRDQIEILVAQMVGYYEAGDADRLVALIDDDALGWWKGTRTRGAYSDFFASTRARRLRMERLAWDMNGAAAMARGEATLLADFADGRQPLERRVPVEIDIELRGGQARITRLILFPGS